LACQLCEKRKARRYCPAVRGDICPVCCGEQREETLDCPLDCEHLQEARTYEKLPELDRTQMPYPEIEVRDSFLDRNDHLLRFLGGVLLESALSSPQVIDEDLRECLDSLARTYKTLETGLLYETVPSNIIAAAIYRRLQDQLRQYRELMRRETGVATVRDADILGVLVFLLRLEVGYRNGRRRSRAFIDLLRRHFEPGAISASPHASPSRLLMP
jgi:hypothetical protein